MKSICKVLNDESKQWHCNGRLHREDGPAVEHISGLKIWYYEGTLHRIDGPAIEWSSGLKEWYYKGRQFNVSSQEEFEKYIKLLAFI